MQERLAIISIGGNTLIRRGDSGAIQEQFEHTRAATEHISKLIKMGYKIVLTHGNGPIVGNIFIRNEAAKNIIPPMPLYICDADSEGGIGFMIQQTLYNQFKKIDKVRDVATIVTQVVVDRNDPAFLNPTKPIGPYYARDEAEILKREKGWTIIEDSRRGHRRVVPSPKPLRIIEGRVIKMLAESGVIVIAAGGGGVPVLELQNGDLAGVDAVIDKDLATSLLAIEAGAELFINLTQIDRVYVSFGKADQKGLERLNIAEARRYLNEGEFAPGSMGPKIEAAIEFLEAGGREVLITSPELLGKAMDGKAGTRIYR